MEMALVRKKKEERDLKIYILFEDREKRMHHS
jgi:hypothetical protein